MCDFLSWVELDDGRCVWNTDNLIREHGMDFQDGIGHKGIRKIWQITGGRDKESVYQIPPEAVQDVRGGKCREMMTVGGFDRLHYNQKGQLNCVDGPALECANGTREWCLNGQLHRSDGPALECANGSKYRFLNGILQDNFKGLSRGDLLNKKEE